jgi:Cu(I)/Ag(I) efflux system membrane fusion protein
MVGGALLFGGGDERRESIADPVSEEAEATIWTCSMHPQIQLAEPGKCPLCSMDLIPLETGGDLAGETQLVMSRNAMRLAEVMTAPVTRQFVEAEVRTVGKVMVDERRLRRITAWVDGRLDRLFVDYTGVPVAKGDHLVEIYSPELYSAQVELIESIKTREDLKSSAVEFLRRSAESTVDASREKLRLLGLRPEQIREIEESGTAREQITLYAPIAGIVIHKAAVEGEYVKTGSPIYTIAELSHVWVMLDVYESDLVWVQYGQKVSFEVEAFPGEHFEGRIAFIDPVVNPGTRTVKVRVNVDNPRLRLKPDMFVRAVIRSRVLGDGRTLDPDLAGKWIGPMHPEIVKDHRGTCDICGMPLVRAEELGFAGETPDEDPPLIIPVTAPLITGKRAVVYIKVPGAKKPTFEGREVQLGPRAGGFYIVEEGLHEGEEVVVNGSFKIDSAMQIQAKPSMMSPEGGAPPSVHQHGGSPAGESREPLRKPPSSDGSSREAAPESYLRSLEPLFAAYFLLQSALAEDALEAAREASKELERATSGIDDSDLSEADRKIWDGLAHDLHEGMQKTAGAIRLDDIRSAFELISTALIQVNRNFGTPRGQTHSLMFCPMAFNNRGAYWLQGDTEVRNPYFGKAMQKCGEIRETFSSTSEESGQ